MGGTASIKVPTTLGREPAPRPIPTSIITQEELDRKEMADWDNGHPRKLILLSL